MGRIDGVLHRLQPVAAQNFTDVDFLESVSPNEDIPLGQSGFFLRRSHVGE